MNIFHVLTYFEHACALTDFTYLGFLFEIYGKYFFSYLVMDVECIVCYCYYGCNAVLKKKRREKLNLANLFVKFK